MPPKPRTLGAKEAQIRALRDRPVARFQQKTMPPAKAEAFKMLALTYQGENPLPPRNNPGGKTEEAKPMKKTTTKTPRIALRGRAVAAANTRRAKKKAAKSKAKKTKAPKNVAAAVKAIKADSDALKAAGKKTKNQQLEDLLRDTGATIDAICKKFGWLEHSARAAIATLPAKVLKNRNETITVDKRKNAKDETEYFIPAKAA